MAVIKTLLRLCLLVQLIAGNTDGYMDEYMDGFMDEYMDGPTTDMFTTFPPVEATNNTPATAAPTTSAPGFCASASACPKDSICQELQNNYTCLCRPGMFYNDQLKSCYLAKTFKSDLILDVTYDPQMGKNNSKVFKETADKILSAFEDTFKNTFGYLGSTVLSLRKGSVIADIDNFFTLQSKVTQQTVVETVQKSIEGSSGIFKGAELKIKDLCASDFCDGRSTNCNAVNGIATCTCKAGFITLTATDRSCLPCPSGEKAVNNQCEKCSFGYSGFNCEESYLLILVVVACVLGSLLLGSLIGTIVLYSRWPEKTTKSSEKNPPTGNLEFNKPAGFPRIPRANANSGWQPTNLEMTDSGSRHALVTKDHRLENTGVWNYDSNDDTRGYRSQMPAATGYGGVGANNISRASKNPYYDGYEDRMRRY